MKLLSLNLRNFKGCRELLLEPGGRDLTIYGDNAAGKTTLADAFYWLLFDKDSQNRKDFELKTLGADGKPFHNLEHEVIAELEHPDGSRETLQKLFKENWVQKRGQAAKEFSGHTTECRINGVPVQKTEFDRHIAGICDEKRLRLLTDPTFFNTQMSWQDRRKALLEVCGDVADEDVISSNPKLQDLPSLLEGRSIDDQRKVLKAQRIKVNDDLEKLPVRIDELSRVPKPEAATVDIAGLRAELQSLQDQRSRLTAGGEVAEIKKQLALEEANLQMRKNEISKERFAASDELRAKLSDAEIAVAAKGSQIERIRVECSACDNAVASVDAQLEVLRSEFRLENARNFEFSGEQTCAACGQALPEERVAEARRKAEEEFNAAKSRRLQANKAEGESLKAKRDTAASKAATGREALVGLDAEWESLKSERDQLKTQLDSPALDVTDPLMDRVCAGILQTIAALQERVNEVEANLGGQLLEIDEQIAGSNQAIASALGAEAASGEWDRAQARIKELGAEEKVLAGQIEQIDKVLFLTEEFIRAKVSMLEEKINSRFSVARFKLFEDQINGGLSEVCEVMLGGVPYGSLNHGARLNVGLDIINALSQHYGFAPPIFVDNAESVTSILPTDGQQIRLVVSASDSSLRIEAATPEGAAA